MCRDCEPQAVTRTTNDKPSKTVNVSPSPPATSAFLSGKPTTAVEKSILPTAVLLTYKKSPTKRKNFTVREEFHTSKNDEGKWVVVCNHFKETVQVATIIDTARLTTHLVSKCSAASGKINESASQSTQRAKKAATALKLIPKSDKSFGQESLQDVRDSLEEGAADRSAIVVTGRLLLPALSRRRPLSTSPSRGALGSKDDEWTCYDGQQGTSRDNDARAS